VLISAKALLIAKDEDEEEWPGIYTSTTGLMFFGTPFRGAEGMSQSEILDAARREYEDDQIQGEVLEEVLRSGNESLQETVDKYCKTRSPLSMVRVACFLETKASIVGGVVGGQARTVSRLR
jgi:hypothetical protein